jgi:hypothetical protein
MCGSWRNFESDFKESLEKLNGRMKSLDDAITYAHRRDVQSYLASTTQRLDTGVLANSLSLVPDSNEVVC